ncbi:PcfJ domain-containing protein [Chitinilyticum litopenaei]|uniref:PcfJ domain-containing protein n=1 Tax=Chitinilyticum piscinae TaxID=2866724 RepID=A0A8J7FMH0_9NEIS|nr:PcfJ domain-containing protein [Chitinilyticum piscinae]
MNIIFELANGQCCAAIFGPSSLYLRPDEIARDILRFNFDSAEGYRLAMLELSKKYHGENLSIEVVKLIGVMPFSHGMHLNLNMLGAPVELKNEIRECYQAFIGRLDQRILSYLHCDDWKDSSAYNSLIQKTHGHYRRQAVQAYPILGSVYSQKVSLYNFIGEIDKSRHALMATIDQGRPLQGLLAEALSVGPETVRWVQKYANDQVCKHWSYCPEKFYQYLELIPYNLRPKREQDFVCFVGICDRLHFWQPFDSKPIVGSWLIYAASKDWELSDDKVYEIELLARMLASFHRVICLYGVEDSESSSLLIAAATKASANWLVMARKWNQEMHFNLKDPETDLDLQGGWPGLPICDFEFQGMSCHELTTRNTLEEEGRKQGHCVGGYYSKCQFGQFHIFSISDDNGEKLSTLAIELVKSDGQVGVRIAEHRGRRNEPPSGREYEIADQLLSELSRPIFSMKIQAIYDGAEKRRIRRVYAEERQTRLNFAWILNYKESKLLRSIQIAVSRLSGSKKEGETWVI